MVTERVCVLLFEAFITHGFHICADILLQYLKPCYINLLVIAQPYNLFCWIVRFSCNFLESFLRGG